MKKLVTNISLLAMMAFASSANAAQWRTIGHLDWGGNVVPNKNCTHRIINTYNARSGEVRAIYPSSFEYDSRQRLYSFTFDVGFWKLKDFLNNIPGTSSNLRTLMYRMNALSTNTKAMNVNLTGDKNTGWNFGAHITYYDTSKTDYISNKYQPLLYSSLRYLQVQESC